MKEHDFSNMYVYYILTLKTSHNNPHRKVMIKTVIWYKMCPLSEEPLM